MTLAGKYGTLTPEQERYLLVIARAWKMSPVDGWAEGKLETVMDEELQRYGLRFTDVQDHPTLDSVKPINDVMLTGEK